MSELKNLDISFETQSRTLLLLDSSYLRILPFDGSVEAFIPTPDFLDLLSHLVRHQEATLVILRIPKGLLERVLGGLTTLADDRHG